MNEDYLKQILPFLNKIDADRRQQFEDHFLTAPKWLLNRCTVENMPKRTTFVREGEPVDMIYFVGEGIVKATDCRIFGINYDFMLFNKVYALGGMEVIINLDTYQTTLQTVTDCIVLKIPKNDFQKWLDSDAIAMKLEARLMGEYLLEQDRVGRNLLFLQGSNRVAYILMKRYREYAQNGILHLKKNRQELSDCTGLCIKTITRSINKFKENGLLTTQGNYIVINYDQYLQLVKIVSEILTENL